MADPTETNYQLYMRQLTDTFKQAPGVTRNVLGVMFPAIGSINRQVNRLNAPADPNAAATAATAAAARAAAPPPTPAIDFGQWATGLQGQRQAPAAPATAAEFLQRAIPGVTINGTDRTPERNSQVGGAANSWHLRHGAAVDFAPVPGMTIQDVADSYRAAGWTVREAIDETKKTNGTGPHWHIAATPPSGAEAVAMNNAASGPGFVGLDPRMIAGLIPTPRALPTISLPDAPQREAPADRPAHELINKETFLAPLAEALKVAERDKSHDAWDRVAGMLQGAAQAAAQAGSAPSTGSLLLAAGGGAAAGGREVKNEQRDLNMAETENRRQAAIALAKAGYDVDLANLGTRNDNADRNWQNTQARIDTAFGNLEAQDQRNVQQILANNGIQAQNIGALNDADRARGSAAASVIQYNNQGQNRNREAGWEANRQDQRAALELGLRNPNAGINGLLQSVGVPAERTPNEDPSLQTVRQVAHDVAAGNAPAAINGLASTLVLSGEYASILGDSDVQAIKNAIDKKNLPAANLIAGSALNNALRDGSTPDAKAVMNNIAVLAAQGNRAAQLIEQNRRQ